MGGAKGSKRLKGVPVSRRERDRRALLQEIRRLPVPIIIQTEEPCEVVEYTFNWKGPGNFLIPRLLTSDERPDITSPALRAFINNIARGEPTPSELRAELLKEPADQIDEAIREGIHRWHSYGSYGKERG